MKILVINWQCIKNRFGGGAEVHLHEIFKRIAAWGHDVTLFCCKLDELESEEIIDGIRHIRYGSRSTFNFHVPLWYLNHFRKDNYDIVIDDINKIPFYTPLYVKKPLLAISHHFFGKSIYHESGFLAANYVYFSEWLVNYIYRKTPFVVVSESTLNEFIERGFNRKNFSIVQNAITQSEFPMHVGIKNPFPTVTYFGRIKKYKSVDHLFYAFAKITQKIPEARLHIIGRGDFQPELERLSKQLNIEDNTTFFGFVSDEDKKKLLSASHVLVNTSIKEGWGITNIESNACGTPVISADVPGLRDSVKNGLSGLLYQYGNIEELADLIYLVLTEKELQNKLNQGSIEWAKSFSWDDSAKLMLKRCEEVIGYYKS